MPRVDSTPAGLLSGIARGTSVEANGVAVRTLSDQDWIAPATELPAASTASSCQTPLAGPPTSVASEPIGANVPVYGAAPVESVAAPAANVVRTRFAPATEFGPAGLVVDSAELINATRVPLGATR